MINVPWDGTLLPHTGIIIAEQKIWGRKYVRILFPDIGEIYAIIERIGLNQSQRLLPCIIDEIKPLFGLGKIGTHLVRIGKTYWLILHPDINTNGEVILDLSLSEIEKRGLLTDTIIRETIAIFLFHDIIFTSSTHEDDIIIKEINGTLHAYDFKNKKVKFNETNHLSQKINCKWLNGCDRAAIVKEMIGYNGDQAAFLSEFSSKLENIINRLDRSYIWFNNSIICRLRQYL